MRKPVLFRVPGCILPLAAIFIAFVFLISVFAIQGNDDGLHSPGSQYLSSETQDDDPGCNKGLSPPIINAGGLSRHSRKAVLVGLFACRKDDNRRYVACCR